VLEEFALAQNSTLAGACGGPVGMAGQYCYMGVHCTGDRLSVKVGLIDSGRVFRLTLERNSVGGWLLVSAELLEGD
jgi:hypothetical protein